MLKGNNEEASLLLKSHSIRFGAKACESVRSARAAAWQAEMIDRIEESSIVVQPDVLKISMSSYKGEWVSILRRIR